MQVKRSKYLLIVVAFFLSHSLFAQWDSAGLVAPGAKPVLISRQFTFTEGPAPDKKGNIYFTDQPNNQIWKYDTEGKLSLFMDSAGRSNGLYIDKKGNIIACADAKNELWSISLNKEVKVLVNNYEGHLLNGPNDLWIDRKGGIYFTDPYYQRKYWTRQATELDGMKVYYLAPKARVPVIVVSTMSKPNGIVGTKDGKTLYVADIKEGVINRFAIHKDGSLSEKELFVPQGADGITLDAKGNLYLCGNGVTVYNKEGRKIAHIDIPEKWTANACFGGKNRNVLFMTASTTVYTLEMNVKGIE